MNNTQGLLADSRFLIGMGLLSSNQPSLTPQNPMQNIMQNMMAGQQMKRQLTADQRANEMHDLKKQQVIASLNAQPKREVFDGADGYKYYADGSRVLPNVVKPEEKPKLPAGMYIDPVTQLPKYYESYLEGQKTLREAGKSGVEVNLPATKDYVKESDLGNYRRWNDETGEYEYPKVRDTGENLFNAGYEFTPNNVLNQEKDNMKILSEKEAVITNMKNSVKKYRGTLEKTGTRYMPSNEKMLLESDYTNMQMNAKNYLELGVLAGEDLTLMEAIAANPTDIISQYLSRDGDLSGFLTQLDSIEKGLDSTLNTYKSIYGVKTPKTKSGLSSSELKELEELRAAKERGEI